MNRSPAAGERSAVRGYRWQYDHIATRVYDALLDGDLVAVRLTDPDAGRVDDLVLVRRGRVDGYQFKSSEFDGYVTGVAAFVLTSRSQPAIDNIQGYFVEYFPYTDVPGGVTAPPPSPEDSTYQVGLVR